MTDRVEITTQEVPEGITPAQPVDNVFHDGGGQDAPERPEWLPEQFNSPEDMAKAYSELRAKMDSGSTEAEAEAASKDPAVLSSETLHKYSEKYYAEGLNENDYAELEKLGVSKELVSQYAAGMSALMDRQSAAAYAEVGGKEQYETMLAWAKESFSEQEAHAFNEAVTSNDQNTVMMAVKGLGARYAAANGAESNLVQGTTQTSGEGSFGSMAQVVRAMNDPRYDQDPAFRAEVLRKMERSNQL